MTYDRIRTWLAEADHMLLCAGAGLSAAAGYDYGDTRRVAELFPALHRLGLRSRYLVGVPLPPAMMWAYWAVHIDDIRFSPGPNPLYRRLRALVGDTDHWVLTSNVDGLFARNGFDPARVHTPQGDYARYQCRRPCTTQTWPIRPVLDRLLAVLDRNQGMITDLAALPACPNCGGEVFPLVRVGPEFQDGDFEPTAHGLSVWLDGLPHDTRLLVLEIGAGFNTPGVIRRPAERLTAAYPNARLIRVNPHHPDVPPDLADRALPVPLDAATLLTNLE
ncbi:NAD-dependent SIR2 family protein deacetylase [Crossiella equi]|uniref:NAD-dependent SIR2 family protein deacetylase n=1 Tax=Crossiella equi TaxID=130796 RepID=A0ABS5A5V2_9PSEU|nr:NAD-dependent protein deacetylase of SIR2 family [Crossiella equi]MBP2471980.1 NAD-dependent SIR2 family protein deacetylase [Crossiella equi]